ncbi:MAG: hypothetical protein HYV16_04760 [Gammaproteobacteria bacterium]|nr:hypothetical protein [Gammaproteobacteria bacterium]
MNRQFWKYYALILVTIILIALGIEGFFSTTAAPADYWVPLSAVRCQLLDEQPCTARSDAQLRTIHRDDLQLNDERQRELQENGTFAWRLQNGAIVYVLRDQSQQLFMYGPFDDPESATPSGLALYLIFFGGIALILLFLLAPAFRDLARLQDHITRLARDEKAFPVNVQDGSLVAPIAHALNRTITQVRQLLEVQKESTHFVAHDMRTPIARMRFSLALQSADPGELQRQLKTDLDELEQIATQYLAFAKQESLNPVVQLAPIDLNALLYRLLDNYRRTQSGTVLELLAKEELVVHADPFALTRALENILANATRFARSKVSVRAERRHGICRICVDDDGEGVPPEARRSLLKPFSQSERGRGLREKGFGLGLYIVVRASLLHGGKAKLLSAPMLGGARIEIVWPDRA